VRLDTQELAKLLKVLEKIDRGLARPRIPGHIGRFLRQYARGRMELGKVLAENNVVRRSDGVISGRTLRAVEVCPIIDAEVSLLGFPMGEVAETVAISEQLGGLLNMTMWLKGPVANSTFNLLRENPGLRLTGDYRWTPPARLTPGEACIEPLEAVAGWHRVRCLKAVADDLARPPHALEYVLDYRLGPPGLKFFRSVCVMKHRNKWLVLPGLAQPRPLEIAGVVPRAKDIHELSALLIYREPWSPAWTVVAAVPVTEEDVLAHATAWADFRKELEDSKVDAAIIGGINDALRATGLRPTEFGQPYLVHNLFPIACQLLKWLHGTT